MKETIEREELRQRLAQGEALTLVEALPELYFLKEHLPGAINIPHDRVAALAPALARIFAPAPTVHRTTPAEASPRVSARPRFAPAAACAPAKILANP